MAGLRDIVLSLSELQGLLDRCMRCGMCQSSCPLYSITLLEPDVARGKLSLLEGFIESRLEDIKGVREKLGRCLLCGSCSANCPSGVGTLEIFLKARVVCSTYLGLSLIKRLVFRGLLLRPKAFLLVSRIFSRLQGILGSYDKEMGTYSLNLPLLDQKRRFPGISSVFLKDLAYPKLDPSVAKIRVGFFVGCLIDKFFPSVAVATMKALNFHQVGVYIPWDQVCCGIPCLSAGDISAFNSMVEINLRIFLQRNLDYIVTPCATCAFTIKELWPSFHKGGARGLKELSHRTMDITQFLVQVMGVDETVPYSRKTGELVTYHDPCHLRKSLKVHTEPRRLIKTNAKYQLIEMEAPDQCCGFGGSFNWDYYPLSKEIGRGKRDQILATGARVVATSCPACMIQLYDLLSRVKGPREVRHVIEIYAEGIDGDPHKNS